MSDQPSDAEAFSANGPSSIMITGTGDELSAVEALKSGAADHIVKDPDGRYLELLPVLVEQVLAQRAIRWRRIEVRPWPGAAHAPLARGPQSPRPGAASPFFSSGTLRLPCRPTRRCGCDSRAGSAGR